MFDTILPSRRQQEPSAALPCDLFHRQFDQSFRMARADVAEESCAAGTAPANTAPPQAFV